MLEARSAYGYYGSEGGYTGENTPNGDMTSVTMKYRTYKQKFADHKTVYGSYDKKEKTIEVLFTQDEMKKKTNLDNRYHMNPYFFLMDEVEVYTSRGTERRAMVKTFIAKTQANAKRNAQKWARENGCMFIREATREDIKLYR